MNEVTLKFVEGVDDCDGCIFNANDCYESSCSVIGVDSIQCSNSEREDTKNGIWVVK